MLFELNVFDETLICARKFTLFYYQIWQYVTFSCFPKLKIYLKGKDVKIDAMTVSQLIKSGYSEVL